MTNEICQQKHMARLAIYLGIMNLAIRGGRPDTMCLCPEFRIFRTRLSLLIK